MDNTADARQTTARKLAAAENCCFLCLIYLLFIISIWYYNGVNDLHWNRPEFGGRVAFNVSSFAPPSTVSDIEFFYFDRNAYVNCSYETDNWEFNGAGMICPVLDKSRNGSVTFLAGIRTDQIRLWQSILNVFGETTSDLSALSCRSDCIGRRQTEVVGSSCVEWGPDGKSPITKQEHHGKTVVPIPIYIVLTDDSTVKRISNYDVSSITLSQYALFWTVYNGFFWTAIVGLLVYGIYAAKMRLSSRGRQDQRLLGYGTTSPQMNILPLPAQNAA